MKEGEEDLTQEIDSGYKLAKAATDELWALTIDGEKSGELDKMTTPKQGFYAGAMSAFAVMHAEASLMKRAERIAKLN